MPHKVIELKIEELKAELLNQYGAVIVFITDWDVLVPSLGIEIIIDKSLPVKTEKDKIAAIQSIRIANLESVEKIKGHEIKTYFTKAEAQEIYKVMFLDQNNPRYEQFYNDYKYSIKDLIRLLDQLDLLSSNLSTLSIKEAEQQFINIFYQYIAMNTIRYGLGNESLKKRIDKTRGILGPRIQIRSQKNKIIKQIVLQEYKKGKNWQSPDQVAKDCIEFIELEFEKFDTNWLKERSEKIELNKLNKKRQLNEIDEDDPKYKKVELLVASMTKEISKIQVAMRKGYPFEEYNNFLSYGTEYIEKSVANVLRRDKSLLEVVLKKD
jgi:hypothetical protein